MSVRLYVGNLPKEEIERQELQAIFAEAGESVTTKVIKDRKTGKCRGFAFVTVPNDEMADALIEKYNGQAFMDTTLKIEKALPRSKNKDKQEESAPSATETTAPSNSNTGSSKKGKRSKRQSNSNSSRTTERQQESFQPDPRWAGELAKLKEMLAAQATNS